MSESLTGYHHSPPIEAVAPHISPAVVSVCWRDAVSRPSVGRVDTGGIVRPIGMYISSRGDVRPHQTAPSSPQTAYNGPHLCGGAVYGGIPPTASLAVYTDSVAASTEVYKVSATDLLQLLGISEASRSTKIDKIRVVGR